MIDHIFLQSTFFHHRPIHESNLTTKQSSIVLRRGNAHGKRSLAPEPPHATRFQPRSIRIFVLHWNLGTIQKLCDHLNWLCSSLFAQIELNMFWKSTARNMISTSRVELGTRKEFLESRAEPNKFKLLLQKSSGIGPTRFLVVHVETSQFVNQIESIQLEFLGLPSKSHQFSFVQREASRL